MQTIIATYENGVLKPRVPLDLPPNAEVRVTIDATPTSTLTAGELFAFLQSLPPLDDDAEAFEEDLLAIRKQFPAETNPWE